MNSLELLINDLDILGRKFNTLLDQCNTDIVAKLITLIGKTTAYDTGVARDLISNILRDLGREELASELEHEVYEYWKSRQERENQGEHNSSVDVLVSPQYTEYDINIDDYGFAIQQDGIVSPIHPRKDSDVIPYNVDYYMDKLEVGNTTEFSKVFSALEGMICKVIEKGEFR